MERTDAQIMEDLSKGDKKAAIKLFERYKSRILNFSLRILGSRADAEDVTSEVFLALISGKYTYTPKAKFSTWAYTVARNSCISIIRKRKKVSGMWTTTEDGTTVQRDVKDSNENSRETLEKKEAKVLVQEAISALPLEQREAIILREYEKLSYDDIAVTLECSLENVKILIYRARETLRIQLTSFLNEEENNGS